LLIVGETADGLSAVEQARELRPDLILLDISLPTLNGLEAARRIRQHSSPPKILFCSQNLSPEIAEKAFGTGAAGYVVKSDAASDLLSAVTAVRQGRRFVSRSLARHDFAQTADALAPLSG
jgi:DNA-binding NarL/FixJ family response regulator